MKKDINIELTKGEEAIMEIFWNKGCPMTSMDVIQLTDEFNECYIHRLLTSLQNKGALDVSGLVKSGKQYARLFVPVISREQYGAMVMSNLGIIDEKTLAKTAVALFKQSEEKEEDSKEKLIKQLEDIIEQLKRS